MEHPVTSRHAAVSCLTKYGSRKIIAILEALVWHKVMKNP